MAVVTGCRRAHFVFAVCVFDRGVRALFIMAAIQMEMAGGVRLAPKALILNA